MTPPPPRGVTAGRVYEPRDPRTAPLVTFREAAALTDGAFSASTLYRLREHLPPGVVLQLPQSRLWIRRKSFQAWLEGEGGPAAEAAPAARLRAV